MMEDHEFCDSCRGCRPAMAKVKTGPDGKPLIKNGQVEVDGVVPDDDPMMVVINRIWDNDTTFAQRRGYIQVTLKNSRDPRDVRFFQEVQGMLNEALAKEFGK